MCDARVRWDMLGFLPQLAIHSVVFVESGKINFSFIIIEQGKLQNIFTDGSGVTEAIELAHFASSPGRLFAR